MSNGFREGSARLGREKVSGNDGAQSNRMVTGRIGFCVKSESACLRQRTIVVQCCRKLEKPGQGRR